jgi:SIR2-like domain/SEC-C motif
MHGSVSSVRSTVFATSDYLALTTDTSYLQPLKYIFAGCTVVFLGYSIRDDYVIRLLRENATEMNLFGPGPHFVITNDDVPVGSLRKIGYSLHLRPDHSAALTVLDYINQSIAPSPVIAASEKEDSELDKLAVAGSVPTGKTAYYISDVVPPEIFQDITAHGKDQEIEASFGLGFTDEELPFRGSTALHDITVGLICFDYVYLPLAALALVHDLLGSQLFWELIEADVIRFVHNVAQVGVLFLPKEPIGDIGNVTQRARDGVSPRPLSDIIRRTLRPVPGKEKEAEDLFAKLEARTAIYRRADEINLPSLIRSALLMPAVSRLLGIGDAILPTQAPRWLKFPYLRLGHLVQTAALCSEYGIQAAKVSFGGAQLTSAAFGVQPAELYADHLASYVSSGLFNSDLGAMVYRDAQIVKRILRFRESAEGGSFRREIRQVLATESGREFNASVNAGLSQTIPIEVLQRARDRLLVLMTESARVASVSAVWSNVLQSDSITRRWRIRSKQILVGMCTSRGIGKNDPCICGSGEQLHLCCLAPLRR